MGNLTENFSYSEFACRGVSCCGHSTPISIKLVECLQKLREIIGKPLHINDGFRCNSHNIQIKGSVSDSQHTLGLAADVSCPAGLTVDEFLKYAEMIPEFSDGGIGIYSNRLHLDIRKGKARWRA